MNKLRFTGYSYIILIIFIRILNKVSGFQNFKNTEFKRSPVSYHCRYTSCSSASGITLSLKYFFGHLFKKTFKISLLLKEWKESFLKPIRKLWYKILYWYYYNLDE